MFQRSLIFLAIGVGVGAVLLADRAPRSVATLSPAQAADSQTLMAQEPPSTEAVDPDVPYVPTPEIVVQRMLEMAEVGPNDVVYDLGSGDGRLVISAVKDFGARRAVGIEILPRLVEEANANAETAGVSDRVEFRQEDLFQADFSEASVVTLYLLPEVNLQLRPRLLSQLKPGTRIISHAFNMGDWEPEETVVLQGPNKLHIIYKWTVPAEIPANLRPN